MGIVDDLLAHPGVYVGIDSGPDSALRGASRLVVTRLPGRAGVALDFEVFNPALPDNLRPHAEHTVIAPTHVDGVVMVVADTHSGTIAILYEGEPGVFEPREGAVPYPQKVVLSVPERGRIRHVRWYASPGEEPEEREISDLKLAV